MIRGLLAGILAPSVALAHPDLDLHSHGTVLSDVSGGVIVLLTVAIVLAALSVLRLVRVRS